MWQQPGRKEAGNEENSPATAKIRRADDDTAWAKERLVGVTSGERAKSAFMTRSPDINEVILYVAEWQNNIYIISQHLHEGGIIAGHHVNRKRSI